jgi:hypothetical protein
LWPFIASNRRNGESKQRESGNLEDSKVVWVSVCLFYSSEHSCVSVCRSEFLQNKLLSSHPSVHLSVLHPFPRRARQRINN